MYPLEQDGWVEVPVNKETVLRLYHYDSEYEVYDGIAPDRIIEEIDLVMCNLIVVFIKKE